VASGRETFDKGGGLFEQRRASARTIQPSARLNRPQRPLDMPLQLQPMQAPRPALTAPGPHPVAAEVNARVVHEVRRGRDVHDLHHVWQGKRVERGMV
jgi:hypothetical protein